MERYEPLFGWSDKLGGTRIKSRPTAERLRAPYSRSTLPNQRAQSKGPTTLTSTSRLEALIVLKHSMKLR